MVRAMLASPSARPAGIKRERGRKARCPGPHGFSQIRSAALRRWLLMLMSTVWLWLMLTLMGVPPPAVTNYWHFPALHLFHTMTTAASNASFTRVTAPAQRNAPAFKKTHSSFTAFNGSEVLCGDCCVASGPANATRTMSAFKAS